MAKKRTSKQVAEPRTRIHIEVGSIRVNGQAITGGTYDRVEHADGRVEESHSGGLGGELLARLLGPKPAAGERKHVPPPVPAKPYAPVPNRRKGGRQP